MEINMAYWVYWTIFSVLAFCVAGIIIKFLWDILQELKFLNKNPKEGNCPHGYSDWDACQVCSSEKKYF